MHIDSYMVWFILLIHGSSLLWPLCDTQNLIERSRNSDDVEYGKTRNLTHMLDDILKQYDMRIRPNANGPAVQVHYDIFIVSGFDSITTSMDYNIMAFIRQYWNDPRLAFENGDDYSLNVNQKMLELIWVPDMYIINEKAGELHELTVANKALRIYPNGTVLYSMRLSLTLACNMDLRKYPMDSQVCHLEMESYGYRTHDVVFKWKGGKPVSINGAIEIPEFVLHDIQTTESVNEYTTGNFTSLRVYFFLKRIFDFHLIQTYVPSILLVVISWVSFWINPEASPARVGLGITTVLTMTAQSTGVRETLPPVAYIKAIDVWMTTCLAFVFAALLEFALVNYVLTEQRQKVSKKFREKEIRKSLKRENGEAGTEIPLNIVSKNSFVTQQATGEEEDDETHPSILLLNSRVTPRLIDRISRFLFPFSYILFNVIYWPICFYGYGAETIPVHSQ
ncbi:glycine receptor subunit alpha-2-like isoform X2 [Ptychodera flava]|uniref:glycine receptor subunit alpha-2-like isoform X2 n=2 Tax=Ptychodera flava TaxID=63121 RepID=UPI00396A185D